MFIHSHAACFSLRAALNYQLSIAQSEGFQILCENLYFASNVIKVFALEQQLWALIGLAAILAAILDFKNCPRYPGGQPS